MTARWQDLAECRGVDPDLFHPRKGETGTNAKAVCHTCPVTANCLMHAITHGERDGIWGGKDSKQRRTIRRQLIATGVIPKPLAPIRHGTHAGYTAHWRRQEPACPACLAAHAAHTARRTNP